jgi:hypothetical protein
MDSLIRFPAGLARSRSTRPLFLKEEFQERHITIRCVGFDTAEVMALQDHLKSLAEVETVRIPLDEDSTATRDLPSLSESKQVSKVKKSAPLDEE